MAFQQRAPQYTQTPWPQRSQGIDWDGAAEMVRNIQGARKAQQLRKFERDAAELPDKIKGLEGEVETMGLDMRGNGGDPGALSNKAKDLQNARKRLKKAEAGIKRLDPGREGRQALADRENRKAEAEIERTKAQAANFRSQVAERRADFDKAERLRQAGERSQEAYRLLMDPEVQKKLRGPADMLAFLAKNGYDINEDTIGIVEGVSEAKYRQGYAEGMTREGFLESDTAIALAVMGGMVAQHEILRGIAEDTREMGEELAMRVNTNRRSMLREVEDLIDRGVKKYEGDPEGLYGFMDNAIKRIVETAEGSGSESDHESALGLLALLSEASQASERAHVPPPGTPKPGDAPPNAPPPSATGQGRMDGLPHPDMPPADQSQPSGFDPAEVQLFKNSLVLTMDYLDELINGQFVLDPNKARTPIDPTMAILFGNAGLAPSFGVGRPEAPVSQNSPQGSDTASVDRIVNGGN